MGALTLYNRTGLAGSHHGLTQRRGDAGENCNCMAHTETQSHRENHKKGFSVAFSSFCGLCLRLFFARRRCAASALL
jgi:hypothetical protein